MRRLALALISLGVAFALSAPPLDAQARQRSRQPRDAGGAQAPAERPSQPARQAVPRRSPRAQPAPQAERPVAGRPQGRTENTPRRAVPRARPPQTSRPAERPQDGRITAGASRPGRLGRAPTGRLPRASTITNRAVPRVHAPLVSRPLVVLGSRPRLVSGYGLGYGRQRRSGVYFRLPGYYAPRLYGTRFFFTGYNVGVGFSVGSSYYYPYTGAYPYAYGTYGHYGSRYSPYGPTGALRLKVRPRHAQVFVDGYFAGSVDDFDGVFQRLRVEAGDHLIEIRAYGYEPLVFDLRMRPGQTMTYEGELLLLP